MARYLDYNDALIGRANLLDTMESPREREAYISVILAGAAQSEAEAAQEFGADVVQPMTRAQYEHLAIQGGRSWDLCRLAVPKAQVYFLPDEMRTTLHQASQTLERHDWAASDLPSPHGILWFESPLRLQGTPVSAIMWASTLADEIAPGVKGGFIVFLLCPVPMLHLGTKVRPTFSDAEMWGRWRSQHQIASDILKAFRDTHDLDTTEPEPEQYDLQDVAAYHEGLRLMAATVLFMRQQIINTRDERGNRMARQRAEAQGEPEQRVKVIQLRRKVTHYTGTAPERDPDAPKVEHDFSWYVDGFWRQQPWGPRRMYRRSQWIHGHVRGPKDKPLKPFDMKVFTVIQ